MVLSEIGSLIRQSSHYLTGHILRMVAGFISFPILTRVLSVEDYGILGLITTTLFIGTAIAKFGLPEAAVRFYAEFDTNRLNKFYTTVILTSGAIGAGVTAFFILTAKWIDRLFFNGNAATLLWISSVLILISCLTTSLTSLFRAQQKTKLYNIITVISRYGSLSLSIFLIFFLVGGIRGFYVGQIIWGFIILCILLSIPIRRGQISIKSFSPGILNEAVKFGFPLLFAELGSLLLNYSDRYLVQIYLGSASLGLYIAAYNLATYVSEVIIYPINYAVTPIYMKMLVGKGEEETKKFLSKVFSFFLLIMLPAIFGFVGVGKELVTVLASSRYMEADIILPYIIFGQAIHASSLILNNGLFIKKKTYLVTIIMIIACMVNIGLNLILIPYSGILGAAQATLISYTFHTALITYFSFRIFSFPIEYRRGFLYLVASFVMFLAISYMEFGGAIRNILGKMIVGALIYLFLVSLMDERIKRFLVNIAYKAKIKSF